MKRRNFIKAATALGLVSTLPTINATAADNNQKNKGKDKVFTGADDRAYWVDLLYKMAEPIMSNMSRGELRKNMTMVYSPTWDGRNNEVGYLEAFGRLIAGIAPWLALPDDTTSEGQKRKQLRNWTLKSIAHSVDPNSPDYLAWNTIKDPQPIVDAAYVAHAFIRSPKALWEPLDDVTKQRVISEFKGLRRVSPFYSNWLLFASIIEAFLLSIDEEYDRYRIDMGVRKITEWYVGDGWYSDGEKFAMDYYNSYVIQPMLVDVLDLYVHKAKRMSETAYQSALKRMQRNAEFLERFISPEGTFPPFGRSITYRLAVFQPLTQLAYTEKLPESLTNAQVRCAISAVMRRMFSVEGNFDANNYLQLGFVGHQPNIADYYTNTGSLYITSLGFLPLGLPANHDFWTSEPAEWTSKKAWSGQPFAKDYAVKY